MAESVAAVPLPRAMLRAVACDAIREPDELSGDSAPGWAECSSSVQAATTLMWIIDIVLAAGVGLIHLPIKEAKLRPALVA